MVSNSPLRTNHAVMTQRGSNEVVLLDVGSYPATSNFVNQTFTWNGVTWARSGSGTVDASGPLPLRADYAMTYDGYNVMMYGGRGESSTSGVLQDTWTFTSGAWTKQAPATVPFGRFKAEAALLSASGANKVVMFGGSNMLNHLNETWQWNGSSKVWTLLTPAHSPSARVDFMLAGGPSVCVLFGGKSSNSPLQDTWSWDGTDWTQNTPTTPPSVRAEASMCYDTANSNWVMFGGCNDSGLLPAETWTLNSGRTAWTKKAPAASPSARVGASMCYDSQLGKVLLFGGNDQAGTTFVDTWSWDGSAWVLL